MGWIKQGVEGFITALVFAVIAFLWLRRTALWKFYQKILNEAQQQFKKDSLDRDAWKKLWVLEWDLVGSIFVFEMDYLRNLIESNHLILWDTLNGASTELIEDKKDIICYKRYEKTIKDPEKYCELIVWNLLRSKFRYCGLFLFFNALLWSFKNKPKRVLCVDERTTITPARNFIPKK